MLMGLKRAVRENVAVLKSPGLRDSGVVSAGSTPARAPVSRMSNPLPVCGDADRVWSGFPC